MLNLKHCAVFILAFILAACGGDDVVSSSVQDQDQDDDIVLEEGIDKPRLGVGSGESFVVGQLEVSLAEISAGGNVQVNANIVDADRQNAPIISENYVVEFTSLCADREPAKAEFSSSKVETSSGSISVTYTAKGCVGEDIISARLYGLSTDEENSSVLHTANISVNVAAAEIGEISFVGTEAPALSIKTIANPVLPTTTAVTFQVIDKFGDPVPEKEVNFSLGNNYNDVEFARDSNITDNSGMVSAIVNSGTTHGVAIINATTLAADGVQEIRTSSQPISITTGIPRQDRTSIATDVFNPGGYNTDHETSIITVTAIDAFGNPVPSGTVINFSAESGGITSYCEVDTDGKCSAVWESSGARPGEFHPGFDLVNERIGMTTILAYTLGEGGFTDVNSNYIFDLEDLYVPMGEPFRDDDSNGEYHYSEFFVDTNNDGVYTPAAGGKYQGALCSQEALAVGHCASLMHVRKTIQIMQSVKNSVIVSIYQQNAAGKYVRTHAPKLSGDASEATGGSFYVLLQDSNGNIPAHGTNLSIESDGYDVSGDKGSVPNSVGLLAKDNSHLDLANTFVDLPEWGALYYVEYEPEDEPKSIKLVATSGSKEVELALRLPPAP